MISKNIFSFKIGYLLLVFTIFYIVITFLTNYWILTDGFYYSAFGNRLSEERIEAFIGLNKQLQWIGYIMIPFFMTLKWIILASVLYVGLFLFNQPIPFNVSVKIIIIAEFAILLAVLVKMTLFLIYMPHSIEEVQFFYPLSVLHFFSIKQVPTFLVYPLQQLNLFEVIYWILITAGIQTFTKNTFTKAIKITASSYGVAMLLWILVIAFVQLQFS